MVLGDPYKILGPQHQQDLSKHFQKKKNPLRLFHFPIKLDSPLMLGHSNAFDSVNSFLLKITYLRTFAKRVFS